MRDALVRFHGLRDVPTQPDAADAVAVALCHLTQSRLREAAGEHERSARTVDVHRCARDRVPRGRASRTRPAAAS